MKDAYPEILIPEELETLAAECEREGVPLYVVGGVVRDAFLGVRREGVEYDVAGPSDTDKMVEMAKRAGFFIVSVYKRIGTVKAKKGGVSIEFTSFRRDSYVKGHRPESVMFTEDIKEDALRRDFTCNAVYYDISRGQFLDPLGGIADIRAKICRATRNPADVFAEDGLRLMRLARISCQIGFDPDPETRRGARENVALIRDIACERIWAELDTILHADKKYDVRDAHYKGLVTLYECGVLSEIIPELAAGDGMAQPPNYHKYDVLRHSLRCVLYAPPGIRLAALLHDVGKPACKTETGHFYRHEEAGVDIAAEIMRRLRVPKEEARRVKFLVRWHMYDCDCKASEKKIRKFIIENPSLFEDVLAIKQADFSACKDDLSECPTVTKWKGIYAAMKNEGVPMSLKELAVRGNVLLDAGIEPQNVGTILKALLYECAIGALPNDEEHIVRRAASMEKELRKR
ncbi:MAG: HD domain-containing protein [Clostridia bacterium]|nr:HD domain-containing protein [Clostridia bacterium]